MLKIQFTLALRMVLIGSLTGDDREADSLNENDVHSIFDGITRVDLP